MSIRYGARTRPGTMVSTWLNGLVSVGPDQSAGAAYFMGGYTSWPPVNMMEKMTFASAEIETLSAVLATARSYIAGTQSSSHGYVARGFTGSNLDSIERLVFSTDSNAAISDTLSLARRAMGAFASANDGYWLGGSTGASLIDTIDKTDFSDDATAAITPDLDTAAYAGGGFACETPCPITRFRRSASDP